MSEKIVIAVDGELLACLRERDRLVYSDAVALEYRERGVSLVEAILSVEGGVVSKLRSLILFAHGDGVLRWQE